MPSDETPIGRAKLPTSPQSVRDYAELTDDFNPIHVDEAFAAGTAFGGPILHGTMSLGLALETARRTLPPTERIETFEVRFTRPVPVGATIEASLTPQGTRHYAISVTTEDGNEALSGQLTTTTR